MSGPIRVLIVSPFAAVRAGLAALAGEDPDIVVAGIVTGSHDAANAIDQTSPHVVLADPAIEDLGEMVQLLDRRGIAGVLLGDPAAAQRELEGSAAPGWAVLERDAEAAEISAACRAVAEGMTVFGRGAYVVRPDGGATRTANGSESGLTARERQVLQLMADGLPNKVIAARLSVSLHTVKFHVASILAKLDVSSRTEAVTQGARTGLVVL